MKTTLREGERSSACIHETNKLMSCFPEVFQQIMTAIAAMCVILTEKKNKAKLVVSTLHFVVFTKHVHVPMMTHSRQAV